jgi:hypothetical protein
VTTDHEIPTLDSEAATLLTEFARACKAAARAVTLYPPSHPAIHISLSRLIDTAGRLTAAGPATFGVLPDNLLLGGRAAPRADQAVRETGALLHDHMIGILTMHSSPGPEGWLPFLQLVSRPSDDVRRAGGVGRVWAATGQRYLDIQEIDYADILRDRGAGQDSRWDDIIRACLNLDSPLDDEALRHLVETCGSAERFGEFIAGLEEQGAGGTESKASALLRMLRGVVDLVSRTDPAKLEPLLKNIAQGLARLSPELLLEVLSSEKRRADAAADLVLGIASRMTDQTLSGFVARGMIAQGGATTRLAQAFQALVPDKERRRALLETAKDEVQQSPLGASEDFGDLWKNAADLLTSYSDEAYVSESYARELSGARTQALEVERVSDDPPERIGQWVTSVGPSEIRALDLHMLLDILTIEQDLDRWTGMTLPAVAHIEDLLLVGDFEGAGQLVLALSSEIARDTSRRAAAGAALQKLVDGTMMTHITSHLRTVDEASVEHIKTLCYAVGPSVIKPLAEALSIEKRANARQRLTQLLIGFGAAGRQSVEQLKGSVNPAVRRTAIYLLREFGGSEALPDLTALLDDAEPHVQREAVRAILLIGTEQAYGELQKALLSGTGRTREALMAALVAMRNERAIPLFEYIVRNIDRKGPLRTVYIHAIESLGALKADQSVDLLRDVLLAGEWWAPFRTAELRRTSAVALLRIGTPDALRVLEDAAERGPRGVRNAVKASRA